MMARWTASFCSGDGRQAGLLYLAAGYRDTTLAPEVCGLCPQWGCGRGAARRAVRAPLAVAWPHRASPRGPSWVEPTPCGRPREPGGTRGQEDRRRGTHADPID